jgi:hypothetical protein
MWTLMLLLHTSSLFCVVLGDVLITYPKGGEVLDFSSQNVYDVTWMESDVVPLIKDLEEYTMVLYTGTNDNFVSFVCLINESSDGIQTEMAAMDPRNFTDSTFPSNLFYFQDENAVPNSNSNA